MCEVRIPIKMAFVCPPKAETEQRSQMLAELKETMKKVEEKLTVPIEQMCIANCCIPCCNSFPPVSSQQASFEPGNGAPAPPGYPCCSCCPIATPVEEVKQNFEPPQVMICYREPCKGGKPEISQDQEKGVIRLKSSKSRELRASILYIGCDCEKRYGLQDDCLRTGCHGSPECLTKPDPTCGPSEFAGGKHLVTKMLKRNGKTSGNGNVKNSSDENNNVKYKYKCFSATLKPPVLCCGLTCPCPMQ